MSQHWQYTLESNKLSTIEVGWTGISLCVDLHNHTRLHEPRCSMRKAPSKVIQALCFFRIVTWWHQKSIGVKGESAPEVFPWWVLRMSHTNFHIIWAVFLLADPSWLVHTQNNSLQWPSTENKPNLSTKEVVWTGCSLCVEWHNHTKYYDPRCLRDELLERRSKHSVSFFFFLVLVWKMVWDLKTF